MALPIPVSSSNIIDCIHTECRASRWWWARESASRCGAFHVGGNVDVGAFACRQADEAESSVATIPDELLFQGVVEVLAKGREPYTQEWVRRYMCVWCNPTCFALYASEMAAKGQPDHYIWLPPGSEWHEDVGFQGSAPGTSFRLEAQVRRSSGGCRRRGVALAATAVGRKLSLHMSRLSSGVTCSGCFVRAHTVPPGPPSVAFVFNVWVCVPWQDGVWHFRVGGVDKVNYWRKGFELILAIAATRVGVRLRLLSSLKSASVLEMWRCL